MHSVEQFGCGFCGSCGSRLSGPYWLHSCVSMVVGSLLPRFSLELCIMLLARPTACAVALRVVCACMLGVLPQH